MHARNCDNMNVRAHLVRSNTVENPNSDHWGGRHRLVEVYCLFVYEVMLDFDFSYLAALNRECLIGISRR